MEISLYEHNEEGYQSLVEKTRVSNFAFLERATGTGKSFILIKFMAMILRKKRILFVTIHESMFNQLTLRDMKSLGVDTSIFEKLDCVLYNSLNKHSAQWYYDNYDVFIFDEAHHCGSIKCGEVVAALRDLVKNSKYKKMIGVTATATRYLDNYVNVCDEYFEKELCSYLGITEAILRGILPAPYYINVNNYAPNLINTILRQLNTLKEYDTLTTLRKEVEEYKKNIEEKDSVANLIKKHGVKSGEKYQCH